MKPFHHHNHCHKIKSLSNRAKLSQPMAQSLQLSEVPTPISAPSGSTETIPERWDVSKILVDNGSQAEILFLSSFEKIVYDKKQLKEPTKPLYGFGGKRIEPAGVITLLISFGTPKNPRTENITFDVVDMLYPYNAIFGWGILNTFEAVLHSAYIFSRRNNRIQQSKGSQKYRARFCSRAQEHAFSDRRYKSVRLASAQTRNTHRIQESNQSRR
jgi:hypothetical protein